MGPSTEHVTILLSIHDGEPYLGELLDSIERQSHPRWTLLVRDDGSGDGSAALVEAHAARDDRIVLLPDDGRGNLGPADSYMTLLALVDDGMFAFCDQDDVWSPHKLAWSVDALRDAPPFAVVATDAEVADETGRTLHPSALARRGVNGPPDMGRLLVNNVAIGATLCGTAAVARAAVDLGEGRPILMHDWWCALVAAYAGEVRLLPVPTIRWRRHPATVTGATPSTLRGRCRRRLRYLAWSVNAARKLRDSELSPANPQAASAVAAAAAIDPEKPTVSTFLRARRAGVRAWSWRSDVAVSTAVALRGWVK